VADRDVIRCAIFRALFITLIDSLRFILTRTLRMVCLWFDRMTDDDLLVKLKAAVKVILTN